MQESAYYLVLQYLKKQNNWVTPNELSSTLNKSRVTIQLTLKRLLKNGWIIKEGESPKTFYKAQELSIVPRETIEREGNRIKKVEKTLSFGLLEDFIRKSNSVSYVTPVDVQPIESYTQDMKPLICFGLDGTLTKESSWKLLNIRLGISEEDDTRLFNQYVSGANPHYHEWISELVSLHKASGKAVSKADIVALAREMTLADGACELVKAAKDKGYDVLLLSGGVNTVVETAAERLGFTNWRACSKILYNDQGIVENLETMGDERTAKLSLLEEFCHDKGYTLSQTICIGGGGNELAIFKETKGILVGSNTELRDVAWKHVTTLSEITELI